MIKGEVLLGVVLFAVWVFALIDCITTTTPRHLPKPAWIALILMSPEIGWIPWFVAGRERAGVPESVGAVQTIKALATRPPVLAPDDDPDFLRSLRKNPPDGSARP